MGSALFACAACGKKFRWKPEIAGKAGRCGCGSRLVAPSKPESAEAVAASLEPAQQVGVGAVAAIPVTVAPGLTRLDEARIASLERTDAEDDGLYDIADDSRPPVASKLKLVVGSGGLCPACSGALAAGAVLCVDCGFDLRRNAKLAVDHDHSPATKASSPQASHRTVQPGPPLQRAVVPPTNGNPHPPKPRADSAMAFPAKPAFKPVLEEEATPALPNTMLETIACVALIALGVALTLLVVMRHGKEPVPLDRAVVQAGIQIVVNLGLMVAAICVATYTIEDAFLDPWWRIILKTCAIGLCPGPIGQIIGAQIGDINGDIAKVFITVLLYLGLFVALFRINILHTGGCVLVIWVIRTSVDYSLYKLEGMRSNSWI